MTAAVGVAEIVNRHRAIHSIGQRDRNLAVLVRALKTSWSPATLREGSCADLHSPAAFARRVGPALEAPLVTTNYSIGPPAPPRGGRLRTR